jgi:hypothetical protein
MQTEGRGEKRKKQHAEFLLILLVASGVRKRRRICDKNSQITHKSGCWTGVFIIIWSGPNKRRLSHYGKAKIMCLMQGNQWEIRAESYHCASFAINLAPDTLNAADNAICSSFAVQPAKPRMNKLSAVIAVMVGQACANVRSREDMKSADLFLPRNNFT